MTGADLPGWELLSVGLADVQAGRLYSSEALLIAIAASRLRGLGLPLPDSSELPDEAELRLYRGLCADEPEAACGRYTSLLRRLDSFARAMERRVWRNRGTG